LIFKQLTFDRFTFHKLSLTKIQTTQTTNLSVSFHQSNPTMKLNLLLLSAAALVNAVTAADTVNLGTAGDYVILTKTGISTVPASSITGNIAVSPAAATYITGFGLTLESGGQFSTAVQITGHAVAADYGGAAATALTLAVGDMQTAYAFAAGHTADANTIDQTFNELEGGDISGLTLTPGVYTFTTDISINAGGITLTGTDTDVFIIRTTGSLKQAASTNVILSGGVLAKNIFWQVAGQVDVGAGSHMEGIILVKTDALFMTGSSLLGRVLAQTACNVQMATITQPAE
jgi:hypothetical protein